MWILSGRRVDVLPHTWIGAGASSDIPWADVASRVNVSTTQAKYTINSVIAFIVAKGIIASRCPTVALYHCATACGLLLNRKAGWPNPQALSYAIRAIDRRCDRTLDTLRGYRRLQLGHHRFELARGACLPVEWLWDASRCSWFLIGVHLISFHLQR